MQNLDDSIYESDIEDIIPNKHLHVCVWILSCITIWVTGIILFLFVTPFPKTVKGNVLFNKDGVSAVMYLSAKSTGEIRKGQKVRLYVENFPYDDYGCLEGVVKQFENNGSPNEEGLYLISLDLKNGRTTDYGYTLPDYLQLQGYGEIIVKQQKVNEIIFKPFFKKH